MARIEIHVPELGEASSEGVVVRWMKQVGDRVARDEPVLEIETDKVDAEIPSPADGVLAEVRVREGQTVTSGDVVGVIETETWGWTAPEPRAEPHPPALPCLRCGQPTEPVSASAFRMLVAGKGVRVTVCRACGHLELLAADPRAF